MSDQADKPTMGSPICIEVVAQDLGCTGMQRDKPGEDPEQRGLPCAVASREQHDLTFEDV